MQPSGDVGWGQLLLGVGHILSVAAVTAMVVAVVLVWGLPPEEGEVE